MTTVTISIPNDARDYLEHRARVHGITLPVLVKKAIAAYTAAALTDERRQAAPTIKGSDVRAPSAPVRRPNPQQAFGPRLLTAHGSTPRRSPNAKFFSHFSWWRTAV